MKKIDLRGLSAPIPGLYTCILPLFSNIFLSETAWSINAKFHVEPPWEVGKEVYINGTGHMTMMATMPIYGKNLKKSNRPRYQVSVYRTIGHMVLYMQWSKS